MIYLQSTRGMYFVNKRVFNREKSICFYLSTLTFTKCFNKNLSLDFIQNWNGIFLGILF